MPSKFQRFHTAYVDCNPTLDNVLYHPPFSYNQRVNRQPIVESVSPTLPVIVRYVGIREFNGLIVKHISGVEQTLDSFESYYTFFIFYEASL